MDNQNNRKTILYLITQSEMGGAQKYILDLAASLKDEYNIIVAFGEQGDKGELAQKLKDNGTEYQTIPHLQRKIDLKMDRLALKEIIKLIKKTQPDIIHLNSSKISILGSAAVFCLGLNPFRRYKIKQKKIVYTAHGWVFHEPIPAAVKYKRLEKLSAKYKNKIICVSQMDYNSAVQEKIAPQNKLCMIHNGISPIEFLTREEARTKLNLESDDLVIGSIGNLYKNKGFEYLINAIKILVDNGFNPKTVIIGEGEERGELENWIQQYRLEKNIFLKGRMEGAKLLKAFDIYICSSIKEGLSYTLIEAMTAARPIIATQVGGNPELIENERTGLLIKDSDPQDISRAIIRLINDPELLNKIRLAAREKAAQEFTLEKMVRETKKVYEE